MSQKSSKKLRREIRKEYREILELSALKNEKFIKPKPRCIPEPIWIFLLGFFIKINHGKNI
jgi:hypothetical protein